MIRKVQIQNFRSLANFQFELGRVNVIIGANGAGKTNILESIAMGAAAAGGVMENGALSNLVRLAPPEYMRSGFEPKPKKEILIDISVDAPLDNYQFELHHDEREMGRWRNRRLSTASIAYEYNQTFPRGRRSRLFALDIPLETNNPSSGHRMIHMAEEPRMVYGGTPEKGAAYQERLRQFGSVCDFMIFAPDGQSMKKQEDRNQLDPLGSRGEGLFRELWRIFSDEECKEQQEEILEHLALFDWFVDIKLQNGRKNVGHTVVFKDRFMRGRLGNLDRNSIEDGFLYMLFYLVLFTSKDTPKFFAIENMESKLNPRICWELMALLAKLAQKHDKQVILTTHNSSTLNGLDLRDDEQRLFVASRNTMGHTRVQRIAQKPSSGTMLSELWTRGYIGGMPDNL